MKEGDCLESWTETLALGAQERGENCVQMCQDKPQASELARTIQCREEKMIHGNSAISKVKAPKKMGKRSAVQPVPWSLQ